MPWKTDCNVGELFLLLFFTLTDRVSTILSNIHVVIANPVVRGLLDRKISEKHTYKASTRAKKQNNKQNKHYKRKEQ